ncbi:MAG: hypothetical protein KC454_02845 [Flavobacteriales bacterium]|nr:hypothetical protein [Flavobacteriales bacterium]
MKKIIYILVLVFGLGIVSCQKQIIKPTSVRVQEAPQWVSAKGGAEGDDVSTGDSTGDNELGDDDLTPGDDGGDKPGDITDPNNDPDGKGQ